MEKFKPFVDKIIEKNNVPIQYDKSCMRCPEEADVLCLEQNGRRDKYDKMTRQVFPQVGTIEECPTRIEIFNLKNGK